MFQTLLNVILPVFLVIGAGYAAARANWLREAQVDALMHFAQTFAIPCLLFRAIATLDLQTSFNPGLLAAFYTGAFLCFCLGLFGARILFKRDWEDCVAIGFCCLFSNTVLLGLPITERAFGPDALTGNFAIIAFHSPFGYGLGITAMEIMRNRGQGAGTIAKSVLTAMFKNPLIVGISLGYVANLSGLMIPEAVDQALLIIIRSALPVALFSLGGVLTQYRPEGDLRTIGFVCFVALIVHPSLVWIFGKSLNLPQDMFRSAVMNAAMAPGANIYVFANLYGRAKRVAASTVLIATGLCLFTVWGWIYLLE